MVTKRLRNTLTRVGLAVALLLMLFMSARTAHAGWRSLSGVLPAYTDIRSVRISADSRNVVFRADVESDERYDLYSVPITGSVPLRLNPPLVAGGTVDSFIITPDSSRVIYAADQEVDERRELYSVPIGGGAPVKLNGAMVTGGNVNGYKIDGASGRVVYVADQQSNDVFELYSVPVSGGAFVKLNATLAAGGDVYYFDIDQAGGRVVYTADQDTNDLDELYSVPIAGGSTVKLNPAVSTSIYTFFLTPGIAYVMFIAKATGASAYELYGNDTPGATPRKRSYILAAGENVTNLRISPTATQVVYTVAPGNTFGRGKLLNANPYGGPSQVISEAADAGYGVDISGGAYFTPDGGRFVFAFQKDATAPNKLQSVNVAGGALNRVDLFVPDAGHNVGAVRISPDSQWVVYEDYMSLTLSSALSAVPTAGGSAVSFGSGLYAVITPDSQRVIYQNGAPYPNPRDLLSVQIFGGGERNLSRLQNNEGAYNAQISANGQWVVFELLHSDSSEELVVSDGAQQSFKVFVPLARR